MPKTVSPPWPRDSHFNASGKPEAVQVMDALRDVQVEQGLAYLFITHDLDLAAAYSHRLAIMEAGRIVETGPTHQVRNAPASDAGRRLCAAFDKGRADAA